ncbi:uncharacterized protein B0J16DRAFT_403736 [Fusarium flagelliforme]|uniref:uncharacterized protein n=1 Tax=Fusarium flagelliforme TaxID=2675880 RepID=UPI001E8E3F46|nr:uncharacterized protein B0J16DRAFT_403736 [Fusarium flagelliforme]KAH7174184.1 hypothetical protein B0J16DRAFT_403736 [Fusarium flagelliforme]
MEHHKGPDLSVEMLDIQEWRSTVKNNETNEVQALLEPENAGFASSSTQHSDANKHQEGNDDENSSTDGGPNNKTDQLYDVNKSTRLQCIVGICVGCFLALACIASGVYVLATGKGELALRLDIDATATEILSLVFNIILTFCIDSMAFVHSVSLRWALYSEQRLEFNTNLRLLTSSSKSGPNRWYTNVFSMICLCFCYGGSSYLLLPTDSLPDVVFLNGVALVVLGLALSGHAIVSTWCLWTRSDSVLTWSSNPLSNCLAAVQNGMLQRREGRCMQPVPDQNPSPSRQGYEHDGMEPVHPLKKQKSIYNSHRHIRIIIVLLWTLAILATGWVFTILGLDLAYAADSGNHCPPGSTTLKWDVQGPGSCDSNMASLSMSFSQNGDKYDQDRYPLLQVFFGLLFITAIQATQSFALHCTELLVNISRDENHWRNAYVGIGTNRGCPKGSLLASDSLKNALTSWEYITLSILKSVSHWSVGQALLPSMDGRFIGPVEWLDPSTVNGEMALAGITFYMTYTRLMLYAALAILLASFATFLALRKRSGPQPATMGHLQTIADLVDDWTLNEKGRIFWGDKGTELEAEIRHAGTSSDPDALDKISLDAIYAG